ncbi:thioredoxin-like protein [Exophiala viscosa]|uniref:Thioredoxin-like protein n=1 Tax=Exophiala viscosa TaxID=2486360 RepID=A0AAN6DZ25_9EURO|nr:thioredoxin-like protein [Exophiala viscosa]
MSTTSTTPEANAQYPMIKMYTNHGCGWCHRVHITLKELGLPFEEVLVDLDNPRPEWFLQLNPRGLVPVFQYTPKPSSPTITLTESAAIVSFLTDLYPSHLLPSITPLGTSPPSSGATSAAHLKYRMTFFTDTYFTKINPLMFKLVGADQGAPQSKIVDDIITLLETEIDPLLVDAAPFFGGSQKITVVEAMTTPFTVRLYDFSNDEIFPASLAERMTGPTLPNFSRWVKLCMEHPSLTEPWDKEYYVPRIIERLPLAKKKYAAH